MSMPASGGARMVPGFRVASTPAVGDGHIARCLALAAAFDTTGTFFIDPGCSRTDALRGAGNMVVEETDPSRADAGMAALSQGRIDALVVDGPHFDAALIASAARQGFCVQIDDSYRPSAAQLVVQPGLRTGSRADAYGRQVLSGPRYALLRPAFAAAHRAASALPLPRGRAQRLLIAAGALDSPNLTGLALDALAQSGLSLASTVLLGAHAPHLADIRRRIAHRSDISLVVGVEDMPALYAAHDLCIGAPGVSLLERACCGLPSILLTQSAMQRPNADAAVALGIARYLGDCGAVDAATLAEALTALACDADTRQAMRAAGLTAVDGRGALRVARAMQQPEKTVAVAS